MRTTTAAVTALAGSLLLAPVITGQANAGAPNLKNGVGATPSDVRLVGHGGGGGGGGGHFGGGMGGAHFGGMGAAHFGGGMGSAHFGGSHLAGGHITGAHIGGNSHGGHFASRGWQGGGRHVAWNNGPGTWHGGHNVWHGHNHDHFHDQFVHNHHVHNRFVAVGWWPGYYDYGYGGYGCGWLRRQALITGSPYWWNRYYACANYY
jgi:hypothetical protein